jgi:hypothetical protein
VEFEEGWSQGKQARAKKRSLKPLTTLACGGVSCFGDRAGELEMGPLPRLGIYHLSMVGRRSKPNKLCLEDAFASLGAVAAYVILVGEAPSP